MPSKQSLKKIPKIIFLSALLSKLFMQFKHWSMELAYHQIKNHTNSNLINIKVHMKLKCFEIQSIFQVRI